jgi:hypothetical protein
MKRPKSQISLVTRIVSPQSSDILYCLALHSNLYMQIPGGRRLATARNILTIRWSSLSEPDTTLSVVYGTGKLIDVTMSLNVPVEGGVPGGGESCLAVPTVAARGNTERSGIDATPRGKLGSASLALGPERTQAM